MDIHPIRNQRDHSRALKQIKKLWGARAGSVDAEKLEVLVTLVDAFETNHHSIDPPDPDRGHSLSHGAGGLTRADLEKLIGSRARVSEILNRKRPLTVSMICACAPLWVYRRMF